MIVNTSLIMFLTLDQMTHHIQHNTQHTTTHPQTHTPKAHMASQSHYEVVDIPRLEREIARLRGRLETALRYHH